MCTCIRRYSANSHHFVLSLHLHTALFIVSKLIVFSPHYTVFGIIVSFMKHFLLENKPKTNKRKQNGGGGWGEGGGDKNWTNGEVKK